MLGRRRSPLERLSGFLKRGPAWMLHPGPRSPRPPTGRGLGFAKPTLELGIPASPSIPKSSPHLRDNYIWDHPPTESSLNIRK